MALVFLTIGKSKSGTDLPIIGPPYRTFPASFLKPPPNSTSSRIEQPIGAIIFFVLCKVFRIEEFEEALNIIKDKNIHFMISVPAFLRLLRTTLEAEIRNAPKFYRILFRQRSKFGKKR